MATDQRNVPRATVALRLLSAIVVSAAAVLLAQREYHPSFDNALIWLRADDVGGPQTPVLGPWSRFGWEHPGPALYFVLALPLRLTGMQPSALLLGAFLIAVGCAIAAVIAASRSAGAPTGAVLALGLGILGIGLGERVISPWNPYILVLPFALFVITTWLWSAGNDRMLLVAVASGTFAAQSHVGTIPALTLIGATACVLRVLAQKAAPIDRRLVPAAGLLAGVLWALPLWEQLTSALGNAHRILAFFLQSDGDDATTRVGWIRGLQLAAGELSPWGPWTGNQVVGFMQTIEPQPLGWLAAPLGLLALAFVVARKRCDPLMVRLTVLLLAALLACFIGYAQIRGLPNPYLAMWARVVAMLIVVAPVLSILRTHARPLGRSTIEALSVLAVACAFSFVALTAELPDKLSNAVLSRFADAARNAFPDSAPVRVLASGVPFTVSSEGLAVILLEAGRNAYLQPAEKRVPGPHRCVDPRRVMATLVLTSGPAIAELNARDGARMIAEYDPLSPSNRAMAEGLTQRLAAQLEQLGREDLVHQLQLGSEWLPFSAPPQIDAALMNRWAKLAAGDQNRRYALIAFAPTTW